MARAYFFQRWNPIFLGKKELFKGLYLEKLEEEAHYFIPDLDGNVQLDEEGLQTYRAVAQDTLPILFQVGYLTIKEYIKDLRLYRLGFPDDEVRYGFLQNLLPAYSDVPFGQTGVWVGRFVQDIRTGDVNSFMERMQSIISSIPYDDFPKGKLKLREQNYQTAVYLIFALMGQFVQTEVHCYSTAMDGGCSTQQRCFGSAETRSQNYTRTYSFDRRADCIVLTADTIYIFEFKLSGNGSAEDALVQIQEKRYTARYQASGKKIVLIGAGFDE